MGLPGLDIFTLLFASGSAAAGAGITGWLQRAAHRRQTEMLVAQLETEHAAGEHLCFSTIEALAYAIEAGSPYDAGHLECVQKSVYAMSRVLHLSEHDAAAVRAAALLHNIGRLGVPEHILLKADALTPEEQEKLRSHSVLGARILASIPFPWPVVPLVRHHSEHWDGNGYPDGLKGDAIPLGARILAVANGYSALLRARPYRDALSPAEALAEIEAKSGTQFDPGVVAAFRGVYRELLLTPSWSDRLPEATHGLLPDSPETNELDARAALDDIAAAQRETQGLYTLAQSVSGSLHLEAVADTVLSCTRSIVPCAACVLFLPEEDGEYLFAQAAIGANSRHLLGSLAQVGSYLTGRAFSRGEMMRASFLFDDLTLRNVSDAWVPFRSTLIVPLTTNDGVIGTINLYAEEPDAFGSDAQRVMRLVATQAARAIDNAVTFAAVQETAYTDPLTGLRNNRYLREHLERELNRASRENLKLAVLNIDLDNFKPINDQFGHARGDQTLRDVAEIFNAHVRNYDLAARYAGDEFVIVLSKTDRNMAQTVVEKLKHAVERYSQKQIAREPDFPKVGISVGVALYPEDAQDLQGLLCRSDAAMYQDKQSKRVHRLAA